MQHSNQPNRIAAEDVETFTAWRLPVIDDNGKVVSSAEKEEKERQEALRRQEQETIEDVEVSHITSSGMTAQDMQDIFDAAEKDGFAQGQAAGFEKGHLEGFEAGRQQGLLEMRQHLVTEQQRFHSIANALMQPLAEQDDAIEKMLVDTVIKLATGVIQRELLMGAAPIRQIVQEAIAALPVGSQHIAIQLNPADGETLRNYIDEHHLPWKLVETESVSAGGCVVSTAESRVDFSLEHRLDVILDQFRNKQLASLSGDDQNDADNESAYPEAPQVEHPSDDEQPHV